MWPPPKRLMDTPMAFRQTADVHMVIFLPREEKKSIDITIPSRQKDQNNTKKNVFRWDLENTKFLDNVLIYLF